jgi:DNA polymerase III gamma/tau subunit
MIIARDAAGSIRVLEELVQQGKEMGQFVSDFTWYMRNLMLLQSNPEDKRGTRHVLPVSLITRETTRLPE